MGREKPYIENSKANISDRVFSYTLHEDDLVWHRDQEDRIIFVLEPSGWGFQYDNGLPFVFEKYKSYFVPKNLYHRTIKGSGDLVIRIYKY